ncbi:MAG TPA: L-threonylcarbamoyladenylate synthase [Candidatus Saccharimonadales bacterium]|nr:L-threonylcarbamoyladenylate synthase [Candidatus Saccharimonadales bacterium]
MHHKSFQTISREEVVDHLLRGEVGVMPTDTVYGLVARASDPKAVAKLYALKNRDHKPGTVIAASTDQLLALGVNKHHIDRVKQWWPNPLSVETPLGPELNYMHQETGRQGFRVVADEAVRAILEKTGPLVTSSANHPGAPGSTNVDEAWEYFGDRVDFYVDGGDLSNRPPSTIVKLHQNGTIEVIREGAVKLS